MIWLFGFYYCAPFGGETSLREFFRSGMPHPVSILPLIPLSTAQSSQLGTQYKPCFLLKRVSV